MATLQFPLRPAGLAWRRLGAIAILASLILDHPATAQTRPYIGYAYPAGGQQGTTVLVRLGGQGIDDMNGVRITGQGVTARLVENMRRLNNQEVQLLNEQLKILKQATNPSAGAGMMSPMMAESTAMMPSKGDAVADAGNPAESGSNLVQRLETRTREFVQTPACNAIASLALIEVSIASDAPPGDREIRLTTWKGISNPLIFQVGTVPEHTRKPMLTASLQVLGKEAQALRKRPPEEAEARVALPCTVNGQIASGEVNRYRFEARKGQHLLLLTQARSLNPFIADAVPGWIQPVLALYDAGGHEVAFQDDFRFKPDPTLHFEVPHDGEYVVAIRDSIYRGREDFVYRLSMGELPFVTGLFPPGGRVGEKPKLKMRGWNLEDAVLSTPPEDASPGVQWLQARKGDEVSNLIPYDLDTLPEAFEEESPRESHAQKVSLPVIINGLIEKPGDIDVFTFDGRKGEPIVAEVRARRLDSPLDSVISLTDGKGNLVAMNDDHEDLCSGANTHQADAYIRTTLPADGVYRVWITDTARQGGPDFAYRLRLSPPRPDFELRATPSSLSLRGKSSGTVTVYAMRRDGFSGPIKLGTEDLPKGMSCPPLTMASTQAMAKLTIRSDVTSIAEPFGIKVIGRGKVDGMEVVRAARPAEDRMQAFLWRQLVPASDLPVLVYDGGVTPPVRRVPPAVLSTTRPEASGSGSVVPNAAVGSAASLSVVPTNVPVSLTKLAVADARATNAAAASTTNPPAKPKFSKQQIESRLRQLRLLYQEGWLTDSFYCEKVAECEAVP